MAVARAGLIPAPFSRAVSRITPSEWRWVAAASGVLLLLTLLPIAVAQARTPAGTVFTGYVVIAVDAIVYQADWRSGWDGAWLFRTGYSTEPTPGVLLFPWYVWTGHLVGRLSGPWLYHAARLAAGLALLAATYALVAECFRPRRIRRWAFVLTVLGGGIGPLIGAHARLGPLALQPTEMRVAGTSASDLISMAPHLPWAAALLCWVFVAALRLARSVSRGVLITGLLAWLGLELIYPQLALLALAVILAWAGVIRRRAVLAFAIAGGVVLSPYLAYVAWVQIRWPTALHAVRLSFDLGDPLGFLILSHLVAVALIAVALARARMRRVLWLPALWIAGMTVFMFLPGARSILGRAFVASSIPFGLLATAGLVSLLRGIRRPEWRRRILALSLAFSSLFGFYSLAQPFWIAAGRLDFRAEYEHAGEADLLNWIAPRTTRQDIILTAYLDGVFVPAQTGARAFVGHPDQTVDVASKAGLAEAFFDSWSSEERHRFLAETRIDYVLTTDPVRAAQLQTDPSLSLLRKSRGAALFQVLQ